MKTLIDTHCHLDLFEDIQRKVAEENVLGIKTISVTNAPSFYKPNGELFKSCSNIRTALGLHPQLVQQYQHEMGTFQDLMENCRYIGEIGLDGSTEIKHTYTTQLSIFRSILAMLAKKDDRILTIHSRAAASETIGELKKYLNNTGNKVILHWFSGSLPELKQAVSNGFYFSINHKMTASAKGRSIIDNIPNNRILTETDAPFTYSGSIQSRLSSLEASIDGIAQIKKISAEEVRSLVFGNFHTLLV